MGYWWESQKPEGKRSLGRTRRRCMDNVRMDLGEVGWGDVDWIGLAQDSNRWETITTTIIIITFELDHEEFALSVFQFIIKYEPIIRHYVG
jgi:hypothetical protein